MKRTLSERVYDLLLHLVPNDGSTRQEMREVFRDAYRDTCRDTGLDSCLDKTQGGTSILRLWPLAIIDLLRTAMAMRRPSPRALFETTFGDLRLGFRALRTSPGSSLVVILTLGLAIGVNSTIFSLGQQVMFPTLPITDIETLVFVRASNPELNRFRAGMSSADLADIRASGRLSGAASRPVRASPAPPMSRC